MKKVIERPGRERENISILKEENRENGRKIFKEIMI